MPTKSEKTRQGILEAAAQTLSRHPEATLQEIADSAGVGRATLHRHFKSRDDLVRELALSAVNEVQEICRPALSDADSPRDALEKLVGSLVPLGYKYRFLATTPLTYSDPEISSRYRTYLDQLYSLAEALAREGEVAADLPGAWVVSVIDAIIYAAWFTVEDGYMARRDAGAIALRTILNGLGSGGRP